MIPVWKIICLLTFTVSLISTTSGGDEWCYEGACGPRYWKGKCKFGAVQSPVNLVPSKTKKAINKKFHFSKEYYSKNQFQILNNGHTVQIQVNSNETSNLIVEGAGWKGKYSFSQMHFHWGNNDSLGSEHLVKGKRFPLELHLVHEQVSGTGGIGVIGVIFGISKKDNAAIQPIIDDLTLVKSVTEEPVDMSTEIKLASLFPTVWDVFRYVGSLTTPPCTEQILWSVFTQRVPISTAQVAQFRSVLGSNGKPIMRNFRNMKTFKTKERQNIFWIPVNKKKEIKDAFKA